jgi:hypothetical protein
LAPVSASNFSRSAAARNSSALPIVEPEREVPFEEAKMRRQFGSTYDDYVARVRRWL